MKITNIMAIAAVAGMVAQAAQAGEHIQPNLTVHVVSGIPDASDNLSGAQRIASELFAAAGVRIQWRFGQPPTKDTGKTSIIVVRLVNSPASYRPGALAYALPYEGTHITVFYDRVKAVSHVNQSVRPVLLAHVMTHEITHMLQGIVRHSESGIMKARWNDKDYEQMKAKALFFAPEDIDLLRKGLAKRGSSAEDGELVTFLPVLIARHQLQP